MKRPRAFTSWLAAHFEGFVALRRASGAVYKTERNLLLAFDRYVAEHSEQAPLLRETVLDYLVSIKRLSASSQNHIVGLIWSVLGYAENHGVEIEPLPERPVRPLNLWLQRQPRILSGTEIVDLMTAARRLPRAGSLRPATAATLLGLLATTGIRIGEALALNVGDLERQDRILTIRMGKFGKIRALPLRESTNHALISYIDHPLRSISTETSSPLFVSRGRLSKSAAWEGFRESCIGAGLKEPWPRPHDLRHTFAVKCVNTWYEQGREVDKLLPALSTYLGHLSVENTRHYLVANGTLLQQAARRFEHHTKALDEVLS